MGPPPRSLAAEAIDCFMVRIPCGPNRIQGRGAMLCAPRQAPLVLLALFLIRVHARLTLAVDCPLLAWVPAVERLKEKDAEIRTNDLTEKSPYKEL